MGGGGGIMRGGLNLVKDSAKESFILDWSNMSFDTVSIHF